MSRAYLVEQRSRLIHGFRSERHANGRGADVEGVVDERLHVLGAVGVSGDSVTSSMLVDRSCQVASGGDVGSGNGGGGGGW